MTEENPTDWKTITDTNVDFMAEKLKELETKQTSVTIEKRKRGRPPKAITPTESLPLPLPLPSAPPVPSHYSELMSNEALTNMLAKSRTPPSSGSNTPRKSSIKFSEPEPGQPDDEASLSEKIDHEILLSIYESFFREPLSGRHNKRKKPFDENTPKDTLVKELKELQRVIGSSDPVKDLGHIWTKGMETVEFFGMLNGFPLMGLGEVSKEKAKSPEISDTFRELLIKYPRLRSMLVLGGFPELRLIGYSYMIAHEVMTKNFEKISQANTNIQRPSSNNNNNGR